MSIIDNWLRDLPQQFQSKRNIEILIAAFSKQLQELEEVFSDLKTKTDLATAEGQNLDKVGTIIPLTRKEAGELAGSGDTDPVISDERYRQFLRYQNLVNTNECTYYDIMEGISLLWEDPPFIHYEEREGRPATMFLKLPEYSLDGEDAIKGRKLAIRSAGVGLIYSVEYKGEIDHSKLEHISLKNVKNAFVILFWGYRALDGTWLLDGSYNLDAKRRYNAKLSMEHQWEIDCKNLESIENSTVVTKSKDCWFLDGTCFLDGTKKLDSVYKEEVI